MAFSRRRRAWATPACGGTVTDPEVGGRTHKNSRRKTEAPVRLLRAGELTAVWVANGGHEAVREPPRARHNNKQELTRQRQQISSMLLLRCEALLAWPQDVDCTAQCLAHPEHRFVLNELLAAKRPGRSVLAQLPTYGYR